MRIVARSLAGLYRLDVLGTRAFWTPAFRVKDTFWPSCRSSKLTPSRLDEWKNRSLSPPVLMNPKPPVRQPFDRALCHLCVSRKGLIELTPTELSIADDLAFRSVCGSRLLLRKWITLPDWIDGLPTSLVPYLLDTPRNALGKQFANFQLPGCVVMDILWMLFNVPQYDHLRVGDRLLGIKLRFDH